MQKTLKPSTIFCHDNLPVMRGINSGSVDLIYLDPPFNKGKDFHAPIGTSAEGAEFSDIWSADDVKDEWHNQINDLYPNLYKYLDAVGVVGSRSAKYYLIYMAVRLLEIHRILKPSGSVYLHCDPTASHYLKILMDTIFGHLQFRNEIVWSYPASPSAVKKDFARKHDIILRYAVSDDWIFNADDVRVPYSDASVQRVKYAANKSTVMAGSEIKLHHDGKIPTTVWNDIQQAYRYRSEATRYPTQKPLALLKRIISASSNEGDLVLDPFCGCATACIAAELLNRKWIGIDVSAKAKDLVKMRLAKEVPADLVRSKPIFRDDLPVRTDISHKKIPAKKDKQLLYGMQDGKCKGCNTRFEIRHFHIDHIVPRSQGGSNESGNLQLLCGNCNSIKGNRPMEYLKARLKQLYS